MILKIMEATGVSLLIFLPCSHRASFIVLRSLLRSYPLKFVVICMGSRPCFGMTEPVMLHNLIASSRASGFLQCFVVAIPAWSQVSSTGAVAHVRSYPILPCVEVSFKGYPFGNPKTRPPNAASLCATCLGALLMHLVVPLCRFT